MRGGFSSVFAFSTAGARVPLTGQGYLSLTARVIEGL